MNSNELPTRRWHAVILVVAALAMIVAGCGGSAGFAARSRGVVVLDPGHGAEDEPGATGNGIIERDSNLDMALRVRTLLEAAGVTVKLTRSTNGRTDGLDARGMDVETATFVDLQARVAKVNAADADVFVSLHSNSFADPAVGGIEAWYDSQRPFAARNLALAELLYARVTKRLEAAGYAVQENGVRDDAELVDEVGRSTPLFVIGPARTIALDELRERGIDLSALGIRRGGAGYRTQETNAPGTLLELFYISNERDAALLLDETARAAMARGIADAIIEFLASR